MWLKSKLPPLAWEEISPYMQGFLDTGLCMMWPLLYYIMFYRIFTASIISDRRISLILLIIIRNLHYFITVLEAVQSLSRFTQRYTPISNQISWHPHFRVFLSFSFDGFLMQCFSNCGLWATYTRILCAS